MAVDDESAEKKSKTQASYRCYLAVEQFMQRVAAKKRDNLYDQPLEKKPIWNLKPFSIFMHTLERFFHPHFFPLQASSTAATGASKGFEK